jgi:Sporulation and spore germination
MRRALYAAVAMTLLAACGIPPDPAPRTIAKRDVPAALSAPRSTWRVYMFQQGQLASVDRAIKLSTNRLTTLRAALDELRKPVTAAETAEGYESEMHLPENRIEVAAVEGRTVTVDLLDSHLEQDGAKLGQVVLTLTEAPAVTQVNFQVHGVALEPPEVQDGGYNLKPTPATRDYYPYVRLEEIARLYFVRDGRLVAVQRPIRAAADDTETPDVTASRYLAALASDGPSAVQERSGYTSYVGELNPGLLCVSKEPIGECSYQLQLDAAFTKLTNPQQTLALGQLLYTLEGWPRGSLGTSPYWRLPEGSRFALNHGEPFAPSRHNTPLVALTRPSRVVQRQDNWFWSSE